MQVFIQGNDKNMWWAPLECQIEPIVKCVQLKQDVNFTTKFKDGSGQEFSSTVKFVNDEEVYLINNDTRMKRLVIFHSGEDFPKHDGPISLVY